MIETHHHHDKHETTHFGLGFGWSRYKANIDVRGLATLCQTCAQRHGAPNLHVSCGPRPTNTLLAKCYMGQFKYKAPKCFRNAEACKVLRGVARSQIGSDIIVLDLIQHRKNISDFL